MGTEFIRGTRDKHRKAWLAAYEAGAADLLVATSTRLSRAFQAKAIAEVSIGPGAEVLLRQHSTCIEVVCDGVTIANAPMTHAWLQEAMEMNHGVHVGHVDRADNIAGVFDIRIAD